MTRDELQSMAAHRLAKDKRLALQWATGVGKSNVALKFIQVNPGFDTLILVPEQNNIQNWEDEFRKFGVSLDNVTISCYASFHKHKHTNWDFIVFDEVPHVDTELRKKICASVSAEYILALGAVISEEELKALESSFGQFAFSRISLAHAMQQGFLPVPTVYVLHMQLDDTEFRNLYNGVRYTDKQMYQIYQRITSESVSSYKYKSSYNNRSKMLRAGNQRKKFLGKLKSDAIRAICNKLDEKGRRYLCFCSFISQADELGGEHSFTSKTPASKDLLNKFNNHEINSLFVVGKLIEGQNLRDIECGVIGQLGGTERITVQEIGRIIRSEKPVLYLPIFDGTKDEAFLQAVTYNIPANCIKHKNFNPNL